jgi:hypothetical protein
VRPVRRSSSAPSQDSAWRAGADTGAAVAGAPSGSYAGAQAGAQGPPGASPADSAAPPPMACKQCGAGECRVGVSRTERNPNRSFYKCAAVSYSHPSCALIGPRVHGAMAWGRRGDRPLGRLRALRSTQGARVWGWVLAGVRVLSVVRRGARRSARSRSRSRRRWRRRPGGAAARVPVWRRPVQRAHGQHPRQPWARVLQVPKCTCRRDEVRREHATAASTTRIHRPRPLCPTPRPG